MGKITASQLMILLPHAMPCEIQDWLVQVNTFIYIRQKQEYQVGEWFHFSISRFSLICTSYKIKNSISVKNFKDPNAGTEDEWNRTHMNAHHIRHSTPSGCVYLSDEKGPCLFTLYNMRVITIGNHIYPCSELLTRKKQMFNNHKSGWLLVNLETILSVEYFVLLDLPSVLQLSMIQRQPFIHSQVKKEFKSVMSILLQMSWWDLEMSNFRTSDSLSRDPGLEIKYRWPRSGVGSHLTRHLPLAYL